MNLKNLYKRYSWEETLDLLKQLGPPPKGVKSVYGPGGSGRLLAEMFATLHGIKVSEYPHEADMILDDEVFTGRTYYRYRRMFPDKPFWALIWNCGRVLPGPERDKDGKRVMEGGRVKRRAPFAMGPHDKGVVINPGHREFLPLKSMIPRPDGALIVRQLTSKKTANP